MKKQHLSLWHSALRRFASVLLLLLFFATLPHSAVKAQTTPQHEVSITLSADSVAEGNSGSSIVATGTVSVSNPTSLNFGLNVILCFTGTAIEGTDYTLVAQNTMDRLTLRSDQAAGCNEKNLLIPLNSSSSDWSFRIKVSGDGTIENDEDIIISIARLGTSMPEEREKLGISSTTGSVTFTIEDDDSPTANFAAASSTADEDEGTVTVAVNLSANATINTDVTYSVSGTATSTTDFASLSNTVQIASGTKTANISIPIIDDNADEPNETIILTLSDGFGYKVGTPNIHTLTINDDDASPVIMAANTARVAEGTTAVLTVTAMDADSDALNYVISGGVDSAQFSIDQSDGDLAFKTAPDFEAPRSADNDNVYEVIVTVSDGTNNTAQTITVTVTDVNESPVLAPTVTKSIAENVIDVLNVMATDEDTGTTLAYDITAGADSARFRIDQSSGALMFKTTPDFETPGSADNDNVYEVEVTASDGTNNTAQTITITVTDVNEAPVIAVQTFSVTENAAAGTTVGTVVATDEDAGDNLIFSITSGNTGQAFTINADGDITVAGTIDHETTPTYTLTVQVSDGDLSATATVTVNVTNVNDNDPMITSPATVSVVENTTVVLTVTATDADAGTTLTYSISGGADRALFSIDANSGALTFATAPDFEAPGSADNSNVYEVEVMASDGTNNAMQTIAVTVTDDPADNILSFSEAEEAAVIFPNPSDRYLEVRSPVGSAFKILSLSGKSLLEGTMNTKVDISSLRSGLYLMQLPDGRLLKFVRE